MKNSRLIRCFVSALIVGILSSMDLFATILVQTTGTGSSSIPPYSFPVAFRTAAFDRFSGTLYVGLASGDNTFSISSASRQQGSIIPAFSGIALNSPVNNASIELLRVATDYGNTNYSINNPLLAVVIENGSTPRTQTTTNVMTTNGQFITTSAPLLDAAGATTSGIYAMDANKLFVFTAVAPASTTSPPVTGVWGELNSGIAAQIIYNSINTANSQVTLRLQQSFNQPGDNEYKAARYDPSSATISINNNATVNQKVGLHWDSRLARLYTAINGTTAGAPGDGIKTVAVIEVTVAGTLIIRSILPNGALVNGQTDKIIAATQAANPLNVGIDQVRVMHNSTGPSYLITGGSKLENSANIIHALPLVDVGNPNDPNQGVLANKNAFNPVTHRFETPAVNNADLTSTSDDFATVGMGPLPLQSTEPINNLTVAGDTVYVSIDTQPFSNNEVGVFYSQAQFDETGKIIRWTPWSKHAFPYYGFSTETLPGPIKGFAVDAANGTVWAVNDYPNATVRLTAWDKGFVPDSTVQTLALTLNSQLTQGCYSVLDLDQSTRGFTSTAGRYALFGGADRVAIAQISFAFNPPALNSAQFINNDFSIPANFGITQLPVGAGAVTTLEYARQLTGTNSNFFFAGTNTGLYAFTDGNGNGFDVSQLANVNQSPLSTNRWQLVDGIQGAIVEIKTTGNALYVMTTESSKTQPLSYNIYRLPFATNIATMAANKILIASSATGSLANTSVFYGMQIIATQPDGSTEQLVIGTNNGLYQSKRIGGVQAASSSADADWTIISKTNGRLFNTIGYIDNAPIPAAPPSTIWPINLVDLNKCKIYNNSIIDQLAGSNDATPFAFVPAFFNTNIPTSKNANTLEPISYFWTDGLRRFIIAKNNGEFGGYNHLIVLPFDLIEWGVNSIENQFVDSGVPLTVGTYYWIRTIGASGIILAGTDSGVIALE